jgi:hypothetical protein
MRRLLLVVFALVFGVLVIPAFAQSPATTPPAEATPEATAEPV